jgi:hypothetical protein
MDVHWDSRGLFALQGPKAKDVIQRLVGNQLDLAKVEFGESFSADIAGVPCFLSRCGYTGEDGAFIPLPPSPHSLPFAPLSLSVSQPSQKRKAEAQRWHSPKSPKLTQPPKSAKPTVCLTRWVFGQGTFACPQIGATCMSTEHGKLPPLPHFTYSPQLATESNFLALCCHASGNGVIWEMWHACRVLCGLY